MVTLRGTVEHKIASNGHPPWNKTPHLLRPFHTRKRWKSQGAKSRKMMVGDKTVPIENASGVSLLQLQCAIEHCHEEGQYLRTTSSSLVLNKWMELQYALHICRETIVLGLFTGSLGAQNWQVRCFAFGGHARDIAQHICAKLRLILTVVLVSRPIGSWKKK